MVHRLKVVSIVVACTLAFTTAAWGQSAVIDYFGFGWETGGLPPSNPGDELVFTGVADFLDPIFGVDLATEEVTFHVYDLISTGEIPLGGGTILVGYTGGSLDIYRDASKNADWGTFPPNATSPSTFSDGTLLFSGSFVDFALFLNTATGGGSYEGNLQGIAGEILASPCGGCAYTWGGAFSEASGAQIPDGYDLQMDGQFEIDESVGTRATDWSSVKALYGN